MDLLVHCAGSPLGAHGPAPVGAFVAGAPKQASIRMAVQPLAMCYPGLVGGTWGPADASIQNNSGLSAWRHPHFGAGRPAVGAIIPPVMPLWH